MTTLNPGITTVFHRSSLFHLLITTFILYCNPVTCSSVRSLLFLFLLYRLGELLDVLCHQLRLFHGSKVATAGHRSVGDESAVLLRDPELGCVHQLVGEAGEAGGNINRYPRKRR